MLARTQIHSNSCMYILYTYSPSHGIKYAVDANFVYVSINIYHR